MGVVTASYELPRAKQRPWQVALQEAKPRTSMASYFPWDCGMQVIVGLSKKDAKHVPYRSSKLTHFLKDSIGGKCQTRLIACIWSDVRGIMP